MTDPYVRVTRRITLWIAVFGAAGAIAAASLQGWRNGLGFALGAALSYLSFWRWQKVAESLGDSGSAMRSMPLMVLRFVLLAAAAYGIVKYLGISPPAVFFGLLSAAAATLVSLCFEFVNNR